MEISIGLAINITIPEIYSLKKDKVLRIGTLIAYTRQIYVFNHVEWKFLCI